MAVCRGEDGGVWVELISGDSVGVESDGEVWVSTTGVDLEFRPSPCDLRAWGQAMVEAADRLTREDEEER
jgi:hypothetical protein